MKLYRVGANIVREDKVYIGTIDRETPLDREKFYINETYNDGLDAWDLSQIIEMLK